MAQSQTSPAGARSMSMPEPVQNPRTGGDSFELYGVGNGQLATGFGGQGYSGQYLRNFPSPSAPPQTQTQPPPRPRAANGAPRKVRRRSAVPRSPGEQLRFLHGDDNPSIRETPVSQRHRDWKIWPIYVKEAMERDKELTLDWDEDMDVLLIFAGLFSAVVTSFLSQNAIGSLSASYDQYASTLAIMQANGTVIAPGSITNDCTNDISMAVNPACFQINWQNQAVTGFWFAALTFSLSAALLAMLSKTWIREYTAGLAALPYDHARQRQYRWSGQKRWKLGAVINSLMMLLHISVFLFFAGLIVFLESLDSAIFQAITTLFAVTLAVYALFSALPLFFPDCPYRFPLMKVIRVWMLQRFRRRREQTTFREQEISTIDKQSSVVEAAALAWLLKVSETSDAKANVEDAALEAMGQLTQTQEQRNAMVREGVLNTLYRLFMDCEEETETDRMVKLLHAIEALWKANPEGGAVYNAKERRVPADDLHHSFFNRLVEILESSQSKPVLAAAVQLPMQFAGYPIAEWPIASRLTIPKMMEQLQLSRFGTGPNLIAALNIVTRVFKFMRSRLGTRDITQQDLIKTIPILSHILRSTSDTAVLDSALGIVDEIETFFEAFVFRRAPSGWTKGNLDLFINDQNGFIGALLALLSDHSIALPLQKVVVRRCLCRLLHNSEIGESGVKWIIYHGGVGNITNDVETFEWQEGMHVNDQTPLDTFDAVSSNGNFLTYLDTFMHHHSVESLAKYFNRPINPVPEPGVFAGLVRRLLRLINTPQHERLRQTRVLELMHDRFPTLPPIALMMPQERMLAEQMHLVREYLRTGALDPSLEPPVHVRGETEDGEVEYETFEPNPATDPLLEAPEEV